MRAGGYALHHSLTLEAAAIVMQAVGLARRRGHAQVTPLHVASAMLSSPTALLKRACLQSHPHPLQCKALEICFNVALNRLPTSTSSPLLGHQSHLPSLSNALVAAFKRAQAHQRRGSTECQQQPILALKVEIEQLVISILDDPSVSRVMREAGFSSTQVKTNVGQAVALEKGNSQSPYISRQPKEFITKTLVHGNSSVSQTIPSANLTQFRLSSSLGTKIVNQVQTNDMMSILEAMMNAKTKNTIIVGDCPATNESLVRGIIEKFDKKDVPPDMKPVQFISVPLFTLKNVSKEEFEVKLGELRSLVKSYVSRGVVLYLGDLDWVSDFWSKCGEQRNVFYCPVECMIMELSRLICGAGESKRLWLMGIATFQTYAKCKIGRPSLETLWSLYPLTIPLGSLTLSLSLDRSMHDQVKKEPVDDCNWLFGIKKQLICCSDCSDNFKKEAEAVMNGEQEFIRSSSSRLPSWLQQYKDENRKQLNANQESDKIKDLSKKWNSICSSVHKRPHFLEKVFNLSSSSPSSSTSVSSTGQNNSKIQQNLHNWRTIFEPSRALEDHQIFDQYENEGEVSKPSLSAAKPELLSNPNSSPNSTSSSEANEDMEFPRKFDELNAKNIEILTNALEKKVPWQRQIIPEIITTILKCRSGMMRSTSKKENRRESWLFFLGADYDGKEIIAKELAKTVFGSHDNFIAIGISSFSSKKADSTEEVSNTSKRARDENGGSLHNRFLDAVRHNPSRVFYVEDVDQLDYRCLKGFRRAIKDGSVSLGDDEVVVLKDAIVIFSSEYFSCESTACSPSINGGKGEKEEEENSDKKQYGLVDLNIATEEGNEDGNSVSGVGILDSVDMQVVFKIQVL